MLPSKPADIVKSLGSRTLHGAIWLENNLLGLIFDDDKILVVEKAYLMHDEPAQQVIAAARKRLVQANAELESLGMAVAAPDVRQQAKTMRDKAEVTSVLKARTNGTRKPVRTIEDDGPAFLEGDIIGLHQSDTQIRARTEAAAREVPDIR